jgi:hypothetical protein
MAKNEKVTAEETVPKYDKHLKYAMYITFIPALIATGLIVVPLLLWIEHLELAGKLNPPKWLVMPIVFAIISFFGFVWACLGRLIERFFNKRYPKDEQNEISEKGALMMSEKDVVSSDRTDVGAVPKGIGGWLIIPAIGLVLGIIKAAVIFSQDINTIQIFTPELLSDVRLWVGIVINAVMIIAAIVVAILFFSKRRVAVMAITILMIASIVGSVIQLLLGVAIFGEVSSDGINPVLHACVFAAIWIPYFVKSKRVKNTFVN